ncbi:hydantoinase/oxoprolinase family protein [Bacillus sp. DTU_2020_1000418_1_SI_GHA_SEK_038]|uniref:hydantoinase/oxoprolinase family protein n=1 Tax=Bacillus sp. DTU_2020_1000418_1_SI_GHA_SEK_038 TaxID=3077585 RepID=UPI0028ECA175|nr:hydantoinase/oxoprolinase family protein [Bacillus sp. DTU_2020_1000418_1_SI_GHA_SEK_038]WNS74741.1 hydantoinase/oxoprolinase family protein [Bacillus sp. DTU_2020_1000418_1_SI_GHA_SEK_038]
MSRYRLGVDIGGTFTDLVVYDRLKNVYHTKKTLTTPHNLAEGVLEAIGHYVKDLSEIEYFVHGTTSGLNAFLERKGANVALIVTKGFRDVYEIGRANRTEMYNIQFNKPATLVEREHIYEIRERVTFDGSIVTPIDEENLQQIIGELKGKNYDAVAVCLMHAYRNPDHEDQIRTIIEKELDIPVSLSSDIAREWREYERVSTTVINAYIAPIVKKYLNILEKEVEKRGFKKDIYIMQSNGGVMTSKIAKRLPLQTLMSGPVGGTIGGMNLTKLTGDSNLICVDMGGTSFDVSMIIDGQPDITAEINMEGFPILSPMVNIHTIGAGGGSIAWVEAGGLRVGPKSAGSSPGPACYGKGGKQPTVTDANLVLGRIDENNFLGGDIKLDKQAAIQAVKSVADQIGLSIQETAEGICDIANAKMADAIRTLTVKRGIDPRDFTLVAFGGAGPMHAVLIADLLDMKKVFVPSVSGTFSAWGMLQTDIRFDTVRNYVASVSQVNYAEVDSFYEEMKQESISVLNQQNIQTDEIRFQNSIDVRYEGQEYTVNIVNETNDLKKIEEDFHKAHLDIYGHNNPRGSIEIVNLRVTAFGDLEKAEYVKSNNRLEQQAVPASKRKVVWNNVEEETNVYSTDDLSYGNYFSGPAIVEDKNSTLVIPPKHYISIDEYLNIEIVKETAEQEVLV